MPCGRSYRSRRSESKADFWNPTGTVALTVDVLARPAPDAPLATHRAVMLAVQMKEGTIIRDFNAAVMAA